jgi:hypothetical protein
LSFSSEKITIVVGPDNRFWKWKVLKLRQIIQTASAVIFRKKEIPEIFYIFKCHCGNHYGGSSKN